MDKIGNFAMGISYGALGSMAANKNAQPTFHPNTVHIAPVCGACAKEKAEKLHKYRYGNRLLGTLYLLAFPVAVYLIVLLGKEMFKKSFNFYGLIFLGFLGFLSFVLLGLGFLRFDRASEKHRDTAIQEDARTPLIQRVKSRHPGSAKEFDVRALCEETKQWLAKNESSAKEV